MKKKNRPIFILEVETRCNQDCSYCYNIWKANQDYNYGKLFLSEYLKAIDKIIKEGKPKNITITGGEPMLREDIFEIIEFIRKKRVPVNIITNGTLLSKDNISRMIKMKVNLFELPLISAEPVVHDKITGLESSFKKTVSAMQEIKKQKGKLAVVVVMTKESIKTIRETIELAIALGADSILLNRVNIGGSCLNDFSNIMPILEDLEKAFQIADSLSSEYEIPINAGVPVQPCLINTSKYKNINFGYCQTGRENPYYAVDCSGNIRPCNHSSIVLGNILENSLEEILNSSLLKNFEKAHPVECKNCKMVFNCQGGCKAAAEAFFGNPNKMDPFLKINWRGIL